MLTAKHLAAIVVGVSAAIATAPAHAQQMRDVPRNRTLISQGWDYYNQVPTPTNLSPYNGVLLNSRNILHYTANESLFYTNHLTNTVIPWQAERMETSPDYREVTITLRPNVRWAHGEPLTAEDVVFTFETLRNGPPEMALGGAVREWVESVITTDVRTIKIRLKKPGPRWAEDTLATGQTTRFVVLPKHVWQGQDPKTFGDFDLAKGWPLGTGPYRIVRSDQTAIAFDRLDHWWAVDAGLAKALPAPERIIYRPATQEAMAQLFTANEIDMGRALDVGSLEAAMARNPNIISWNKSGPVWGVSDGCTWRFVMNNQAAPFDRIPVRQALASMIDRDQVANLAFEGSVPTARAPFSSYQSMQAYTKQLDPDIDKLAGKPDPARAEQLLTNAGFKRDADKHWHLPDGAAWQITINTQQGDPIGPVLAHQLGAFGVDTVFRPMPDAQYFDAMASGNYNTVVFQHCGSVYDPWQTLEHFHSKYAPPPGQRAPNLRAITRYANPTLDAILDKMSARAPSPNDADYMQFVRDATRIVLTDEPQVSLTEEIQAVAYNTTYWTGWPTAADPYIAPFQAWDGFALVLQHLKPRQ